MHVMPPLRKNHGDDERVNVRDHPGHQRNYEPWTGVPAPENDSRREKQSRAEHASAPCVICGVLTELHDVGEVTDDLHRCKRDQQDRMSPDDFGMRDPHSASYAQIENRVRNAVVASQSSGIYTESPSDSSVIDVGQRSHDERKDGESAAGSDPREDHDHETEQYSDGGESQRGPASKSPTPAGLRVALGLCGLLGIVWIASTKVDFHGVIAVLDSASLPLVVIAASVTFLSTVIKGVRWWTFLGRSSDLGVGQVVRLTIESTGLNSLFFANSGDVMRVGVASRKARVPVIVVLESLAADKLVEIVAFSTIAIGALSLRPLDVFSHSTVILPVAIVAVLIVSLAVARVSSRTFIVNARNRLNGRDAIFAYFLSLISWLGQIATYALGARAVGVRLPLAAIVHAVVLVNIAGIFRLIPGNLGVFQVMFAVAVTSHGASAGAAIAAAALIQSVQLVSAVAAGLAAGLLDSFLTTPTHDARTAAYRALRPVPPG